MKKFETAKDLLNGFLDILYPVKCCCCGVITPNGDNICANCRDSLEYIDTFKRCKFCGKEKSACDCGIYVHRHNELLSVFKYTGTAKKIMLRYKISKKRGTADFFAQEMAIYINQVYKDYHFDEICYVPVSRQSFNKRGYNQSKLIAEKLAKIFKINLNSSLKIKNNRSPQHKSANRKERFEKSRYKYCCTENLNGKTILLIDDIATTGATLDDCTRALLFAGAEAVYCAVATVTSYDRSKETTKKKQKKKKGI